MRAAFGVALEPGAPGFRSVIPVRKQSCTWTGGVPTPPHPHPQASLLCWAESGGWGGGEEGRVGGEPTSTACLAQTCCALSTESQFPLPQKPRYLEGGGQRNCQLQWQYNHRSIYGALTVCRSVIDILPSSPHSDPHLLLPPPFYRQTAQARQGSVPCPTVELELRRDRFEPRLSTGKASPSIASPEVGAWRQPRGTYSVGGRSGKHSGFRTDA